MKLPVQMFKDKEKSILDPELLSSVAEKLSSEFAKGKKGMSSHQIRKFYNQVLVIRQRIMSAENREDEFKRQLPFIKMLRAQAYYAAYRQNSKVSESFKEFIDKQVAAINDMKDFEAFCSLFEAIVAFFVAYENLKKTRR